MGDGAGGGQGEKQRRNDNSLPLKTMVLNVLIQQYNNCPFGLEV